MKKTKIFLLLMVCMLPLVSCSSSKEDEPQTDVSIACTPMSLLFAAEGGTQTLVVKADREFAVYTDADWLRVSPESVLSGSHTISVTADENKTYDRTARTATVTLKSGNKRVSIDVQQAANQSMADDDIQSPLEGYKLVWHDEFDGRSLGADWTEEVKNAGWVNSELQNYIKGTTVNSVADGKLSIRCYKGSDGKIYSGRIYACRGTGWTYGYFEASIKLPKGKGTWPAFWMMPVNFKSWPADGENDIMEEVGYNPNYVSSTIHCNRYNNGGTSVEHFEKYLPGAQDEFHTYACEWTPDYIAYFVDGVRTLTYRPAVKDKDNWPFDAPFYLILNLAWGGSWGGLQGVDETALPATMEVDYVRVFQK